MTPQELADRIKADILADVRAGAVPADVGSFSRLHDFVDANCYGGTEELLGELDAERPDTDGGHRAALDALCELMNAATALVDAWIGAGGIAEALAPGRRAEAGRVKVTVYRPRTPVGPGAPEAFLGDDRPARGDWVRSAGSELPEGGCAPRLLLLGRDFLIYSMYHARQPYYLGLAVENFGAACRKLGYALPLKEAEANWRPYNSEALEPADPEEYQFLLGHIATVFGPRAALAQGAELGIDWPGPARPRDDRP